MVRRSVELDPTVYGGSGSAFLAYVATRAPGTTLEGAGAAWERAMTHTGRRNLLAQVVMARTYALRSGDRTLYVALLREVLEFGERNTELELSNQLAKRRAARYLSEVHRLFPE